MSFPKLQTDQIEHKSLYHDVLPGVIQAVSHTWGDDFFSVVIRELANAVQADYAFIARVNEEKTSSETIVMLADGQLAENVTYDLIDTPCKNVGSDNVCVYEKGISSLFPRDRMLVDMGVEGYIGVPLLDRGHKVMGLIVGLFKQEVHNVDFTTTLFELFAGRIAAEIDRSAMSRQLTEQLETSLVLQRHLEQQALRDPLSGLPNRKQFNLDVGRLDDEQTYWIAKKGIDCFKPLNDTLGDLAGDEILQNFCMRCLVIQEVEPDIRVYRWIGDEVVFLIAADSQEAVRQKLKKHQSRFETPMQTTSSQVKLSHSTGISCLSDCKSINQALTNADIAMFRAKQRGGHEVCFHDKSLKSSNGDFLIIQSDMSRAMAQGEFIPFYQPIYNGEDQQMVGFESLMRWFDSKGRIRYNPAEFIKVAECTGLIVELGKQIMERSIGQLYEWNEKQEHEYHLSINLSPVQFFDDTLLDTIHQICQKYPVRTELIKFEITESLFLNEGEFVLDKLNALKMMGFQLSLDDFGTGYSSLSYIQKYPFDIIKIDKCFIDDVLSSKKSQALVQSVLTLANHLAMKVVAEGVENEEQALYLAGLGVDLLQGFYLSKPLSAVAVESIIHLR